MKDRKNKKPDFALDNTGNIDPESSKEESRILKTARLKKPGIHPGISRRNFVKTGILGSAGSATALSLNSCSKEKSCSVEITFSHDLEVNTVAISPDEISLSGNTITLDDHDGAINSLAVSTDGTRFVSGSADKFVGLWDLSGYSLIRTMADPDTKDYLDQYIDCDEDVTRDNVYKVSCSCDMVCTCDAESTGGSGTYWYPN